jgi:hypothetical protein
VIDVRDDAEVTNPIEHLIWINFSIIDQS